MALTRKMLKAMGIEDEKIDQIIEAHTDTVDALKEERDSYKDSASKLTAVQKELETTKAQLADNSNDDSYKVKYDAIKADFEQYKADVTKRETQAKKEKALTALLKELNVSEKRIASVVKVTDASKIVIDSEGNIKDKDELAKSLKSEWADFIVTESVKGADTASPPDKESDVDYDGMSDADYYKATYAKTKE